MDTYGLYDISHTKHTLTGPNHYEQTEKHWVSASEDADGAVQDFIEGMLELSGVKDAALHQIPFAVAEGGAVTVENKAAAFRSLRLDAGKVLVTTSQPVSFFADDNGTGFAVGPFRYTNLRVSFVSPDEAELLEALTRLTPYLPEENTPDKWLVAEIEDHILYIREDDDEHYGGGKQTKQELIAAAETAKAGSTVERVRYIVGILEHEALQRLYHDVIRYTTSSPCGLIRDTTEEKRRQ